MPERRSSTWHQWTFRKKLLFGLVPLLAVVLIGEVAARIAVRMTWDDERIRSMTEHSSTRGQFESHPYLPYVLHASYETHNELGFRGESIPVPKPNGRKRIAFLGASTTYGIYVRPNETAAAVCGRLLRETGADVDVINAGVPGWISPEILLNLQLRVLPLQPDVVVFYEGRNELFPQAYKNFAPDYTHYRRSDYHMKNSNYLHKPLFKVSHLLLLAATYKGDRLGWSRREEHPDYGGIDFTNQPTPPELVKNLGDTARGEVFRRNLRLMIASSRAAGAQFLGCTFAFDPERLATGYVEKDSQTFASLRRRLDHNNQILRDVCAETDCPIAETAILLEEHELMLDDCHMNAKGHARRAQMVVDAIKKHGLLANSTPRQ